jgi:XTP/dITP diphosphohydrolase
MFGEREMTSSDETRLVLATENRGKLEELRILLAPLSIATRSAKEIGIVMPPETGTSYLENAAIKATAAARALGMIALGDDTGLAVASLGGTPGVQTASFAASHGGWHRACEALADLTGIRSETSDDVRATLSCALVLAHPDGTTDRAEAAIPGRLHWPPSEAPGLAAMFTPDPPWSLLRAGVLVHRRIAFERLLPALVAALKQSGR